MQVSKANGSKDGHTSSNSNNGSGGDKNDSSHKNGSSNGPKNGSSGDSHNGSGGSGVTNGNGQHTNNGSGENTTVATQSTNGHTKNGSSNGTTVSVNGQSSYDGKPTTSATTGSGGSANNDDQKEGIGMAEPLQRHTGTVKWFNVHMGWGWITRDDPPESDKVELFVHIDDIEAKCEEYKGKSMMGLRDGESVEFSIAAGRKPGQFKAVKVTGVGGNSVIGQALRGEKRPFADASEQS